MGAATQGGLGVVPGRWSVRSRKEGLRFWKKDVTAQAGWNVQRRAKASRESGSFLKKRTKKLCEFGFGFSG
jgi:hypothetical protein